MEHPGDSFSRRPASSSSVQPSEAARQPAPLLSKGQQIQGRYEIVGQLGSGGVGVVFAARHIGFDDLVALKFLRPELATNERVVSRFTQEARSSFRLHSEHVVRVLDVDLSQGMPFIAMELLEGSDLRDVLDRRRRLRLQHAVDCALQVCEALASAHALGIIHRDLKPENLFLSGADINDIEDINETKGASTKEKSGHLKVLDFGLSKILFSSNDSRDDASGHAVVGTHAYMSPEQINGDQDLDARSDLWSLGCVLYELLTGEMPFERETVAETYTAVLEHDPAEPCHLRPAIPRALSDIVMRCLSKEKTERFKDVGRLADALLPFASPRFSTYPARCRAYFEEKAPATRKLPSAATLRGAQRQPARVRQLHVNPRFKGAPQTLNCGRRTLRWKSARTSDVVAYQARLPANYTISADVSPGLVARRSYPPTTQSPVASESRSGLSNAGTDPAATPEGARSAGPSGLSPWAVFAFTLLVSGYAIAHVIIRERPARLVQLPAAAVVAEPPKPAPSPASPASKAVDKPTPAVEAPDITRRTQAAPKAASDIAPVKLKNKPPPRKAEPKDPDVGF